MKVNKKKLELSMARACINGRELAKKAGIPLSTVQRLMCYPNTRTKTLGKLARALGVDPLEIMEQEE